MPRYYSRATSTRFATALLAFSAASPPTVLSFSSAHPFLRVSPNALQPGFFALTSSSVRGGGSTPRTMSTTSDEMTAAETATAVTPDPKLTALRRKMEELDLDVYLVPSDDPHLSEYTPDAYKRRAFLTGFQGSAGTAVVTRNDAMLWTDSR